MRVQGFCTLQPSFTVADWEAAAPLVQRCVELMRRCSDVDHAPAGGGAPERGCIFHGFTRRGDQLVCRQARSRSPP